MPLRKESERTRKRRQELARLRQGVNGKWESNKSKAAARRARRGTMRIGQMLAGCKARRAECDAEALRGARALARELDKVTELEELQNFLGRLGELTVSVPILNRSGLAQTLRGVIARCATAKAVLKPILQRWRDLYRQGVEASNEASSAPSAIVHAAKAKGMLVDAAAVACAAATAATPLRQRPQAAEGDESSSSSSSTSSSSSSAHEPEAVDDRTTTPRKSAKQQRITAFSQSSPPAASVGDASTISSAASSAEITPPPRSATAHGGVEVATPSRESVPLATSAQIGASGTKRKPPKQQRLTAFLAPRT